jgi:hypothetical protein
MPSYSEFATDTLDVAWQAAFAPTRLHRHFAIAMAGSVER